jgi:hypothetical protein
MYEASKLLLDTKQNSSVIFCVVCIFQVLLLHRASYWKTMATKRKSEFQVPSDEDDLLSIRPL